PVRDELRHDAERRDRVDVAQDEHERLRNAGRRARSACRSGLRRDRSCGAGDHVAADPELDALNRDVRASARASRHQMSSYAWSATHTPATKASATTAGTTRATGIRSAHAIDATRRPPPIRRATRYRNATYENR